MRTEEARLRFLRFHQAELRMSSREELIASLGEHVDNQPGRIYLPATFVGGPRYMDKVPSRSSPLLPSHNVSFCPRCIETQCGSSRDSASPTFSSLLPVSSFALFPTNMAGAKREQKC